MKCVGIDRVTYISEPDMSVTDHLINMGRMVIAAKNCKCNKCRDAKAMAKSGDLGSLAVRVEMARRNEPVKVFKALVEGWSVEQMIAEFGDK